MAGAEASVTGAKSVFDVLRHLIHYGPARNDAERDELTAVVDEADPDTEVPDPDAPPELTAEEKAKAYDELLARQRAETTQATTAGKPEDPA